uniref:Uncharacterized protein n=1 Tax=Knipowitschia caucasica TaxID=637954 RepID=A0AAV2L9X3_KNICA
MEAQEETSTSYPHEDVDEEEEDSVDWSDFPWVRIGLIAAVLSATALVLCILGLSPPCESISTLSQRQNLLQDHSRTATYHRAILLNEADFQDKVVLDVGGSGILSFFAVQAGAARVYSLQSGLLLKNTQSLVEANGLCGRIVVLDGDLCPEKVDVLLFEPTGHLLLSEPLSQTQLLKGRSCLKPAGLMFPSWADLHFAPFSDEQLYFENYARAAFWQQRNFYGISLNSLHNPAVEEFFRQPIVETFDAQILMSHSVKHLINFEKATAEDLQR